MDTYDKLRSRAGAERATGHVVVFTRVGTATGTRGVAWFETCAPRGADGMTWCPAPRRDGGHEWSREGWKPVRP